MNAFPNPHRTDMNGMTLRDYFAAKAMQGWLSAYSNNDDCHMANKTAAAKFAYGMADAMMEARNAAQD